MNKTILTLGITALVLGGVLALPKITDAYQGDPSVRGPNYTEERHEAMEKAFENKDYSAWKEQMQGKGRITDVVNESNFLRFAEAHELAEEGKFDEAKQIRVELGLGVHNGEGKSMGQGYREGMNR